MLLAAIESVACSGVFFHVAHHFHLTVCPLAPSMSESPVWATANIETIHELLLVYYHLLIQSLTSTNIIGVPTLFFVFSRLGSHY